MSGSPLSAKAATPRDIFRGVPMPEVPIASKHIKDALATDARNLGQYGATIGRWSAMRGRHQQSGCSPYGDGPIGYSCEPRVKIGPVPPRRARTAPTIVGTV